MSERTTNLAAPCEKHHPPNAERAPETGPAQDEAPGASTGVSIRRSPWQGLQGLVRRGARAARPAGAKARVSRTAGRLARAIVAFRGVTGLPILRGAWLCVEVLG